MKIAVVLATYNGERFLPELLSSLLGQTRKPDRIFVRDDSSTDGTPSLLLTYSEKEPCLEILPSEKRLGAIQNFSALLEAAREYDLLFLADQDDIWHPKKIETFARIAERHSPEAPLLIHSDLRLIDNQSQMIAPSFWAFAGLSPQIRSDLSSCLMQNTVTGAALAVNRPLLQKALPIPEEALMHDHWLALVAFLFGQVIVLPDPQVDYRQHDANVLGARKYSLASYLNRPKSLSKFHQAKALLSRFSQELSPPTSALLSAFATLPNKNYFAARRDVLRYGFYKQGFLRNLALFLHL